ncbi:hypothetical protein DSN97_07290 [Deferribacteraceae bacterium V6Fe1]|nr:hypothetical protein DSN97_07290 [Deferribacteraceae bacterium V6Fe1]
MKNSLNDILVFKRKDIKKKYLKEKTVINITEKQLIKDFKPESINFIERDKCENNVEYKQIIPYLLVTYLNKMACYQRNGSENRLHGKYSVGIGGHVEKQDYVYQALIPTIHNAIYRELSEEFLDFNFYETELAFLGVINEELTDVGHTHIGFVYLLNTAKQFAPGKELDNLEWLDIADIYEKDLELWSKLALELML